MSFGTRLGNTLSQGMSQSSTSDSKEGILNQKVRTRPCIRRVDDVSKIEDNFILLRPQSVVLCHFFNVGPNYARRSGFCC